MSFQDLLNQPLPSKVQESADIENNFDVESELLAIESEIENTDSFNAEEALLTIESEILNSAMDSSSDSHEKDSDSNDSSQKNMSNEEDDELDDIEDDLDMDGDGDFDIDDLDDAELAALDSQLGGDELDSVAGDDLDEEELTPEEEIEADDMMKVAATTMLVNDELNMEEKAAFLSNEAEINTAINEGFMTETDANMLAIEAGLVTEAKYNNKMIIKLDAASKRKQLYALAVNVSAAAHQDKDYQKLKKVMKMRKILRARLDKKYHTEATKRMKIYFKRLRNSKSNTLSAIGNKEK